MRATARVILILKQALLRVRPHETLAQLMVATWLQEPQKKSLTATLESFQATRKKPVLQVKRNSAAKTPLRQSKETNFCWPCIGWQTTANLQILLTFKEFPSRRKH